MHSCPNEHLHLYAQQCVLCLHDNESPNYLLSWCSEGKNIIIIRLMGISWLLVAFISSKRLASDCIKVNKNKKKLISLVPTLFFGPFGVIEKCLMVLYLIILGLEIDSSKLLFQTYGFCSKITSFILEKILQTFFRCFDWSYFVNFLSKLAFVQKLDLLSAFYQ